MSPLFSKRDRDTAVQADGFAVTFAKHPARPHRGLVPGRRVWATLLTMGTVAGLGVVAVPVLSALDDEPRTRPVAQNATVPPTSPMPAAPRPTASATPTAKPSERANPVVTKTVETERDKRRRKARRLPQGPNFTSVKGVVMRNAGTGMCADTPPGGGKANDPTVAFSCAGSLAPTQRWDLLVYGKGGGPGGADLFVVHNSKNGMCFDLYAYRSVPDGDVKQWRCSPGPNDNQMWYLQKRGHNRFWIRNLVNGKRCLDVEGQGTKSRPGSKLKNTDCGRRGTHLWSFQ